MTGVVLVVLLAAAPPPATGAPAPRAAASEDCQGVAGLGAMDEPVRWRGVVDRIEGTVAIVEVGIGRFVPVPLCRLPRAVREGDAVALGPGPPAFWPGGRRPRPVDPYTKKCQVGVCGEGGGK